MHEAEALGHEARVVSTDHTALKLWLRMLSCATQIESEIRRWLRANFDISLARFDCMARLYRHHDGLKMNQLSHQLMVTTGNVTGLTDELVATVTLNRPERKNPLVFDSGRSSR
jgi:hypothetical protein